MEKTFRSVDELKEYLKTLPVGTQISIRIEVQGKENDDAGKEENKDIGRA